MLLLKKKKTSCLKLLSENTSILINGAYYLKQHTCFQSAILMVNMVGIIVLFMSLLVNHALHSLNRLSNKNVKIRKSLGSLTTIPLHTWRWSYHLGRVKRIWYLSPMRAAKVQASLRIRAVSPEPPLLAHTSSESRGTFRQKSRSLAPLNCWACAVKFYHDGMLEDTNSLDAVHLRGSALLQLRSIFVANILNSRNCIFAAFQEKQKLIFSSGSSSFA